MERYIDVYCQSNCLDSARQVKQVTGFGVLSINIMFNILYFGSHRTLLSENFRYFRGLTESSTDFAINFLMFFVSLVININFVKKLFKIV